MSLAQGAAAQTSTRATAAVVILPITTQAWGGGATLHAPHTPAESKLLLATTHTWEEHTPVRDNTHT